MVAIDESQQAETSVQLLREFERTGDAAPFEAFMRRHAAMVYATCLKVTRDPHDAEDATQATFLTLASKSRLNGEIRQPEAWLRKVAHRLSLDLIRSKKRRINRENLRSEMTSEAAPLDSSDYAGNGELKGILNEELAKLPASYRMPLILHYFGGLSREEMAAQLKLKPSTLGVRLHRAREHLRKRLSNRGIVLPALALTALLAEVVRGSVCTHLMSRTAQQASAIAMGQASAPVFAAGPGLNTLRLVSDLVGGSKLRIILSSLVLGSAISVTSGDVQRLLPKFIRELIPSLQMPEIPRPTFTVPMPRLLSEADAPADHNLSTPLVMYSSHTGTGLPRLYPPQLAEVPEASASDLFGGGGLATKIVTSPALLTPLVPIGVDVSAPAAPSVRRTIESGIDPRLPIAVKTPAAPIRVTPSLPAPSNPPARPEPTPSAPIALADTGGSGRDLWNGVYVDPGSGSGGGPSVPLARVDVSEEEAADPVTAAVVGTVPELSSGGGGASSGSGTTVRGAALGDSPPRSAVASRTATFAGTSANYGGYTDADWASSSLVDLSGSLLTRSRVQDMSFAPPSVPGEADTLSINGARVTLRNASSDEPVTIAFVDTANTALPALPTKHHFIGVWELDTQSSFDAVDLLVRYDDLRAARLGLSEQILKLWVSDGESWTLLWKDATFGRDVYKNLLWVTAGSDVKFFAVSAPEPAALTVLIAASGFLAKRRRIG